MDSTNARGVPSFSAGRSGPKRDKNVPLAGSGPDEMAPDFMVRHGAPEIVWHEGMAALVF
jgi:hypothetical protein